MRRTPLPRPAAISVEDHADVPGNRGSAQLTGEAALVGPVGSLRQTFSETISEAHEFAIYAARYHLRRRDIRRRDDEGPHRMRWGPTSAFRRSRSALEPLDERLVLLDELLRQVVTELLVVGRA